MFRPAACITCPGVRSGPPTVDVNMDNGEPQDVEIASARRCGEGPSVRGSPGVIAQTTWTTARCNRLLRPLSSRISLLRKLRKSELRKNVASKNASLSSGFLNLLPVTITQAAAAVDQPLSDRTNLVDTWESSPRPRKKVKCTYSSRFRVQAPEQDRYREGLPCKFPKVSAVHIPFHLWKSPPTGLQDWRDSKLHDPSPSTLLTSMNTSKLPSNPPSTPDDQARQALRPLISNIHKIPKGLPRGASYDHFDSSPIYSGLGALLIATDSSAGSPQTLAPQARCRSLFATCLKTIPKYIANLQDSPPGNREDDGDVDISTQVYGKVESLSPRHVRHVLRAHGVEILGSAIKDGTIGIPVAKEFAIFCRDRNAHDEAQALIDCMMVAVEAAISSSPPAARIPRNRMTIVGVIHRFASVTGRYGYFYQGLAEVLEKGFLPVMDIIQFDFGNYWKGVIDSLVLEDDHSDQAVCLVRTVVRVAYGHIREAPSSIHEIRVSNGDQNTARSNLKFINSSHATSVASSNNTEAAEPNDGSYSTIVNLLTAFSVVNYLQTASSACNIPCLTLLRELGQEARQAIELSSYTTGLSRNPVPNKDRLWLPLLAAGLATMTSSNANMELIICESPDLATLATLPLSRENISDAGAFMCAIARLYGQVSSNGAFKFIGPIVELFSHAATHSKVEGVLRSLCRKIAIAAAFAFAKEDGRPRHQEWAMTLEGKLNSSRELSLTLKPAVAGTPAQGAMHFKFDHRWEDGICEWIKRTPATYTASTRKVSTMVPVSNETGASPSLEKPSLEEPPESPSLRPVGSNAARGKASAHAQRVPMAAKHSKASCVGNTLRSVPSSQRSQKKSKPQPLQGSKGDDIDELSVLASSQELSGLGSEASRNSGVTTAGQSKKRKTHVTRSQFNNNEQYEEEGEDELSLL